MGYAVIGWSGWHSKRPRMDILELATRQWDTRVAEELIRTTCQVAWSKGVREVRAVISVHDPYRSYLTRTGFLDQWGYTMQAKWLRPQRYLDTLADAREGGVREALAGLAVQLNIPGEVSLTLGNPPTDAAPGHLRVPAEKETAARLLFQRVEVAAAVREGALLLSSDHPDASESEAARLALAFPWTPWVFHMLDYI